MDRIDHIQITMASKRKHVSIETKIQALQELSSRGKSKSHAMPLRSMVFLPVNSLVKAMPLRSMVFLQ